MQIDLQLKEKLKNTQQFEKRVQIDLNVKGPHVMDVKM